MGRDKLWAICIAYEKLSSSLLAVLHMKDLVEYWKVGNGGDPCMEST
ncbi:hypothetical protein CCACVL1_01709 [Corchorus capsularis]|uniref:Uncharacterized protein n=1 Tax=Corchorus capsularis TaxID=210143 RepID=A0A1R3KGD2_COCAP|nr:hypothetical protein CCACVL1_01709 [Corchorus capsularis]